MAAPAVHDALSAWRHAERRWETIDPGDPEHKTASLEVISAWLSYHEATDAEDGSFVLIVDDERRYVGVSRNVTNVLGYAPEELVGQSIENVVAATSGTDPEVDWLRFLVEGRQEGEYSILDRERREVRLRYKARAHHPVPGYHLSRLWPPE